MRLKTLLLTLIAAAMLIIAACSASVEDADDGATDEEPTVEAVDDTAVDDEATDDATDDADPAVADDNGTDDTADNGVQTDDEDLDEIDEEAVRLEPFPVLLVTDDDEQVGQVGAYLWWHESGVGAETESGGFVIHEEPIVLQSGEEIRLETPVELFPREIELAVYNFEENIEEDVSTREGRMDAFVMQNPAVLIEDLEDISDHATWTVDVDPGEYFIRIYTVWEDPEFPIPDSGTPITLERPRFAEFAFRVVVE